MTINEYKNRLNNIYLSFCNNELKFDDALDEISETYKIAILNIESFDKINYLLIRYKYTDLVMDYEFNF